MQFYSLDTIFSSLRDEMRRYLHRQKIYYELSQNYSGWHFEIYTDAPGAAKINRLITRHSITEQ